MPKSLAVIESPKPAQTNELKAISLKGEINANHRECLRAGNETIQHAVQAGELLLQVKSLVPHGQFEKWVKQYCDFSHDVAKGYMALQRQLSTFSKGERAHLLDTAGSVTSLKKLLKPKENSKSSPKRSPTSGFSTSAETAEKPDTDDPTPEPEIEAETEHEPEAEPEPDKCPNCAGVKWKEDEDGKFCSKCNHPYGEPAGDVDDKRIGDMRSKTIKTTEALLRAFDYLHHLKPKSAEHKEAVAGCKALLKTARAWK